MRIKKLLSLISENELFYLTEPSDMLYYAGFTGEGAVIIGHHERVILTDGRYIENAQKESDFEVINKSDHCSYLEKTNKAIVIQSECTSYARVNKFLKNGIMISDKEIDFDTLRAEKDSEEIISLKKAAEIAEKSLMEIIPMIKACVTEKELAAKLNYAMLLNGAEKVSFDTIFVSGKNTSLPHGVPTNKKIENGDFVTVDFGCVYNGYCSDMTRTFAVTSATDEMKNVYNVVKNAQELAQKSVKEGALACCVDKTARDYISDNGYGDYFNHSTGHGVGLKIHEKPNVSSKSEDVLKVNNIITIEPGIYIPEKFGVRIENTVVVKHNFGESLQKFEKELIIL